MSELVIVVPTRLRPHAVAEMAAVFADTCTADTALMFCVDGCPRLQEYWDAYRNALKIFPHQVLLEGPRRRLVGTLNYYAVPIASSPHPPAAIGYMGDDHRPLTYGWDSLYLEALRELGTGLVYGNDLLQGPDLCTQVAMTTDIVAALEFFAPPTLTHMYCDNFWLDLGRGANCLTYFPGVVIEHRHPGAGVVAWDESYRESNSAASYATDKAAYDTFVHNGLSQAIATVAALRATP